MSKMAPSPQAVPPTLNAIPLLLGEGSTGGKSEIRNPKFKLWEGGRRPEFRIPNSEFRLVCLVPRVADANVDHQRNRELNR